jgi:hypothetical protein
MVETEGTRIARKKWGEQLPKKRRGTVCRVNECGKAAPRDSQLGDERNGKIDTGDPAYRFSNIESALLNNRGAWLRFTRQG